MSVGEDGKPVDFDHLISAAVHNRMSLVRYRTFLHADGRKAFVSFVDLSDRVLPTPGTKTCEDFEFSPLEGLAAGTLSGTGSDITIYRLRGVRPNGTLDKQVWIRSRPAGVTGLKVSPNGEVRLTMPDGRREALAAP